MKALSIDLRERGVAVLLVHPGWVRTDMGGPGARLSVEASVDGLQTLLDRAELEHSGRFFDVDGSEIPW
jgi:NAD(P)-dependent dehydrogenase (short-subunit alcohol dehydrogenase family)